MKIATGSSDKPKPVVIITTSGDIHASAVADMLMERDVEFHLVFTDRLSSNHIVCVEPGKKAVINTHTDKNIDLSQGAVVWWRRIDLDQKILDVEDPEQVQFMRNEWGELLYSGFSNNKSIHWINDPHYSKIFGNKIKQLEIAREVGFQVPTTYVTNSFDQIAAKVQDLGSWIIKPLSGSIGKPLYTKELEASDVNEGNWRLSPVIVQQKISSNVHLRINLFGARAYTFKIENDELDWRKTIGEVAFIENDCSLIKKCRAFLDRCGLEMGIFDFIFVSEDEIYFLENNPQGQFMFLEPTSKYPITEKFVEYLIDVSQSSILCKHRAFKADVL